MKVREVQEENLRLKQQIKEEQEARRREMKKIKQYKE